MASSATGCGAAPTAGARLVGRPRRDGGCRRDDLAAGAQADRRPAAVPVAGARWRAAPRSPRSSGAARSRPTRRSAPGCSGRAVVWAIVTAAFVAVYLFVGTTQLSIHRLYRKRLVGRSACARDAEGASSRPTRRPADVDRPARRRARAGGVLRPAAQRHRARRVAGGHVHDLPARGPHRRRRRADGALPLRAARRPAVERCVSSWIATQRRRVRVGDGADEQGQHQRADGRDATSTSGSGCPNPRLAPDPNVRFPRVRLDYLLKEILGWYDQARPLRVRRRRRALGQPRAGRAAAPALLARSCASTPAATPSGVHDAAPGGRARRARAARCRGRHRPRPGSTRSAPGRPRCPAGSSPRSRSPTGARARRRSPGRSTTPRRSWPAASTSPCGVTPRPTVGSPTTRRRPVPPRRAVPPPRRARPRRRRELVKLPQRRVRQIAPASGRESCHDATWAGFVATVAHDPAQIERRPISSARAWGSRRAELETLPRRHRARPRRSRAEAAVRRDQPGAVDGGDVDPLRPSRQPLLPGAVAGRGDRPADRPGRRDDRRRPPLPRRARDRDHQPRRPGDAAGGGDRGRRSCGPEGSDSSSSSPSTARASSPSPASPRTAPPSPSRGRWSAASRNARGAELWVVPNPSGLNAHETIDSLAAWYRQRRRRRPASGR